MYIQLSCLKHKPSTGQTYGYTTGAEDQAANKVKGLQLIPNAWHTEKLKDAVCSLHPQTPFSVTL